MCDISILNKLYLEILMSKLKMLEKPKRSYILGRR
jgi:hypothetical protein